MPDAKGLDPWAAIDVLLQSDSNSEVKRDSTITSSRTFGTGEGARAHVPEYLQNTAALESRMDDKRYHIYTDSIS